MKKLILILFAFLISTTIFAQKNELKAADKALKKNDYTTAKASVEQAEGLVTNADDKTKVKFYYLKAITYAGLAKTATTQENINTASNSFKNLFALEEKMGSSKYTDLARPTLDVLISDASMIGIKSYQAKNYKAAKNELYLVYNMSSRDTAYLEYAANAAYLEAAEVKTKAQVDYNENKITEEAFNSIIEGNKDNFLLSASYFQELIEVGYTGVVEEYSIKNISTGTRESKTTKSEIDLLAKSKEYTDPQVTFSISKKPDIVKNIAYCYVELGEVDMAVAAVKNARKLEPNDVNLILMDANLQYKLGNKEDFTSLMKEAIEQDPTNATLYFNLGVMSMEQEDSEKAKEYYNKAIELKPDYKDAYVNLGSILLEKDTELVEEMNDNLSNFDKYDAIKARQVELYKEVIPIYEKAYELTPDDIGTIRTLMSLYENVEMEDKFQEMKALYDALK